jgi:hypothetical protein
MDSLSDTWDRLKRMPWWWWAVAGVSVIAASGLYAYFHLRSRDLTDREDGDGLGRPYHTWHSTLQ